MDLHFVEKTGQAVAGLIQWQKKEDERWLEN